MLTSTTTVSTNPVPASAATTKPARAVNKKPKAPKAPVMGFRPSTAQLAQLEALRKLRAKLSDSSILGTSFSLVADKCAPEEFLRLVDEHEAMIRARQVEEDGRRRVAQLEEQLAQAKAALERHQTLNATAK